MREMTKEQIVLQKRAGENMKEYEVIWEIFNKCPRNQMRDVFVDEVEIEDPEEYVKNKFKGKEVTYEKTVLEDGTSYLTSRPLRSNRDVPLRKYKLQVTKRIFKLLLTTTTLEHV